ncbi:MAG: hypothetical protein WC670_15175 [Pseudolabrys sp.]
MTVTHIHTFLVHPKKATPEEPEVIGTTVPLTGGLYKLLNGVYEKADHECDVDITFRPTLEGKQENICRDLVIDYLQSPNIARGKHLAERLSAHTDRRSGLGLLFLIVGKVGAENKVVVSRFPTDDAIYVDDKPNAFSVQYLERVFMKNKTSYKAVLYRHRSLTGGFWSGRAIDKQLNPRSGEPSDYWISDFLVSEFTATPAQGTRRFATAIRDAAKKAALGVKQELAAAATIAAGFGGLKLSIDQFCARLSLSSEARNAILSELRASRTAQEIFQFDAVLYKELVPYKSIELSNGAMMTADTERFDKVFKREDGSGGEVRFTTKGKIVDEKLKTSR